MKRKLNFSTTKTSFKKRKITERKKPFWVNATDTKNFILKDYIVDVFKINRKKKSENNFTNIFFEKGKEFEKNILEFLKEKFKSMEITEVSDKITRYSCEKTISLMKKGVPVIYSAPFKSLKFKTKGIIDLLVRSDFLHFLTGENLLSETEKVKPARKIGAGNYHYTVIDIKFSTLNLLSDNKSLSNSGLFGCYKSQTWIYTQAIGNLQGYTSNFAFILGRRNSYKKDGEKIQSFNSLNKLGVIDFSKKDKIWVKTTENAIKWLKKVYDEGEKWNYVPPSNSFLYPNMKIDSGIWNDKKREIAEKIDEITLIWNCSVKQRERAFKNGVFSWRDERCNSQTLGLKGKRGVLVDNILKVNREEKMFFLPDKISVNTFDWREEKPDEIFVDFETFLDIFSDKKDITNQDKTDRVFVIGVYLNNEYKSFFCKNNSDAEEKRILNEFLELAKGKKIWHWYADEKIWNRCKNKYGITEILNFSDLSKVFLEGGIAIKDCFSLKLKEIAKAMRNHDFISANLEKEKVSSGLEAAVKSWNIYSENTEIDSEKIKDILRYNEFDVKVLKEILNYLRNRETGSNKVPNTFSVIAPIITTF